jgi:hypothetical protein
VKRRVFNVLVGVSLVLGERACTEFSRAQRKDFGDPPTMVTKASTTNLPYTFMRRESDRFA